MFFKYLPWWLKEAAGPPEKSERVQQTTVRPPVSWDSHLQGDHCVNITNFPSAQLCIYYNYYQLLRVSTVAVILR